MRRRLAVIGLRGRLCLPMRLLASEPAPTSRVTPATAAIVLMGAPPAWRECLELLCDLVEKEVKGKDVLPRIDHGRVNYFITFWQKVLHQLGAGTGVDTGTDVDTAVSTSAGVDVRRLRTLMTA